MLKLYCRACGSPTEYTLEKPKACKSCGTSLLTSLSDVQARMEEVTQSKGTQGVLSKKHPPRHHLHRDARSLQEEDDNSDVDEQEREQWSNLDLSKLEEGGLEIDIEVQNPRNRTEVLGNIVDKSQLKNSPQKRGRGRPKGSKNKPKGSKKTK